MTEINTETFIKLALPETYSLAAGTVNDPNDPWQTKDLEYLSQQPYSANWSQMGCYKTTTGLWLMDKLVKPLVGGAINPISIFVTTKSGKGTYFDAIPKSIQGYHVYDLDSNTIDELQFLGGQVIRFKVNPEDFVHNLKTHTNPVILLIHYHALMNRSRMAKLLRLFGYAFIAVDEAHRIKEKDNQWTRNLKMLTVWTGYKHIMTGTGFINRPQEMWSLLNFLDPAVFSSYKAFRKTFCDEYVDIATGYTVVRGVKSEMLDEFRSMRMKLGPRRTLPEIRPDIDEPVFTPLTVELNPTQRRMYNEIKQLLAAMDQSGETLVIPNVLAMLSRLRQVCVATPEVVADYYDPILDRRVQEIKLVEPSSKLDAVMEFLESLEWDDESRDQVVIFSNFEDPLTLLQQRLEKADIPYLWMKAKHSDAQRYEMWHDTWPEKKHQVFMSTLQLGSESINLSAAKYCIFLDRSWSPKDNNQGVSRVYRPGQTGTAQIIHINASNTTDQRIERVNMLKGRWFNQVFSENPDDELMEYVNTGVDKFLDELLKEFGRKSYEELGIFKLPKWEQPGFTYRPGTALFTPDIPKLKEPPNFAQLLAEADEDVFDSLL